MTLGVAPALRTMAPDKSINKSSDQVKDQKYGTKTGTSKIRGEATALYRAIPDDSTASV